MKEKKEKKKDVQLCRLLDVEDWDKNEQIAQKVRSIIHKEEKVKNKAAELKMKREKVTKKREKSKS